MGAEPVLNTAGGFVGLLGRVLFCFVFVCFVFQFEISLCGVISRVGHWSH